MHLVLMVLVLWVDVVFPLGKDPWPVTFDGGGKLIPFLTGDWCTARPQLAGRRSQVPMGTGQLIGLPAGGLQ